MPIRFRCVYCDKLLGIARRKAGAVVGCPHCGEKLVVPTPEESAPAQVPAGVQHDVAPSPSPIQPPPLPPANPPRAKDPAPPPPPRAKDPAPVPPQPPVPGKNVPLFERSDFEELLNPEPTFRSNDDRGAPAPAPVPRSQPESQPPPPKRPPAPKPIDVESPRSLEPLSLDDAPQRNGTEGIFISRTRMTWISVIGVLLLAAVFGIGIAVGRMLK